MGCHDQQGVTGHSGFWSMTAELGRIEDIPASPQLPTLPSQEDERFPPSLMRMKAFLPEVNMQYKSQVTVPQGTLLKYTLWPNQGCSLVEC